jgi:hypothetical protein
MRTDGGCRECVRRLYDYHKHRKDLPRPREIVSEITPGLWLAYKAARLALDNYHAMLADEVGVHDCPPRPSERRGPARRGRNVDVCGLGGVGDGCAGVNGSREVAARIRVRAIMI